MEYVRDALFLVGTGLIGAGTGFYDWRLGCIAAGAVLVTVTVLAYAKGER